MPWQRTVDSARFSLQSAKAFAIVFLYAHVLILLFCNKCGFCVGLLNYKRKEVLSQILLRRTLVKLKVCFKFEIT